MFFWYFLDVSMEPTPSFVVLPELYLGNTNPLRYNVKLKAVSPLKEYRTEVLLAEGPRLGLSPVMCQLFGL